jgi:transketolase C-terminal domain/subunit
MHERATSVVPRRDRCCCCCLSFSNDKHTHSQSAPTGFNGAVGHERFFEIGIAEQDAASFAAGLALRGIVPVFGTYSNFLKRCCEQIFINLAEGARVVYAGNYSGLCYHTDGKSHQSINDVSVFVGMPGLVVVDPVSPRHAVAVAEWAVSDDCKQSVYVLASQLAFLTADGFGGCGGVWWWRWRWWWSVCVCV